MLVVSCGSFAAGHLAVLKRLNGLTTAVTYTLPKGGQSFTGLAEGRTLEFEEESYSLSFGKQGPIESNVLRVVYSSFVTPESTFDFNMITGMTDCCCSQWHSAAVLQYLLISTALLRFACNNTYNVYACLLL